MSVERFTIEFNENVYYPGQFVGGKIVVGLNKSQTIRVIKLKLSGKAKCTKPSTIAGSKKSSKEKYLSTKVIVAGDDGDFSLDVGEHEYPFSVKLPESSPANFRSANGFITYYGQCKLCTIDTTVQKVKCPFNVKNILNLNYYPQLMIGVNREDQRYSRGCCNTYPTTLTVALPQSAFVYGHPIPISVDVDNSKKKILGVTTTLLEVARLSIPQTNTVFFEKREVKKKKFGKVDTYSVETWDSFLDIEDVKHVVVLNCTLIQTYYEVRTIAKLENGSILVVTIPIIIGDIRYDPIESQQLLSSMRTDQNDSVEKERIGNIENNPAIQMKSSPKLSYKYKSYYYPIYLPGWNLPILNLGIPVVPITMPARLRSSSQSSLASSISWSSSSSKSSRFSVPQLYQDDTADTATWVTLQCQPLISDGGGFDDSHYRTSENENQQNVEIQLGNDGNAINNSFFSGNNYSDVNFSGGGGGDDAVGGCDFVGTSGGCDFGDTSGGCDFGDASGGCD